MAEATEAKRVKNFSDYETNLLAEISKSRTSIISKAKDSKTLKEKDDHWKAITGEFNSDPNVTKRGTEVLKIKFQNMVARAKKEECKRKVELYKTGGGTNTSGDISNTSASIIEMMPGNFASIDGVQDDDCISCGECQGTSSNTVNRHTMSIPLKPVIKKSTNVMVQDSMIELNTYRKEMLDKKHAAKMDYY